MRKEEVEVEKALREKAARAEEAFSVEKAHIVILEYTNAFSILIKKTSY
jgi:hypothetical protein